MKMLLKKMVSVGSAAVFLTASADGWVFFDREEGKWNFSVGGVYDSGAQADFRCTQHGSILPTPGLTAAEAEAKAKNGTQVTDTRTEYASGAWIDSNDDTSGVTPGMTGYYHIPGAPGEVNEGRVFSLGRVAYCEVLADGDTGTRTFGDSGDYPTPGVSVELSRQLYRDDENHWGVDLAFAFIYLFEREVYRESRSGGAPATVNVGEYEGFIDTGDAYIGDDPSEDFNWGGGGTYYGCSAGGAGYAGVINPNGVYTSLAWSDTDTIAGGGSVDASADYQNLDLMFLAKPYYDVTDWFRIVGTLGVAVSRQELDFTATMMDAAGTRRYDDEIVEWDVYGIAGIGASFRYDDWTLGIDYLARFFDDGIEVDNRDFEGSVERGDWMFRVTIGYTF